MKEKNGKSMKFTDKYSDMKPIDDVCNGIMRGTEMKPCLICNDPTEYIEINYEAHFCSEECVKKMDATYFEECKKTRRI